MKPYTIPFTTLFGVVLTVFFAGCGGDSNPILKDAGNDGGDDASTDTDADTDADTDTDSDSDTDPGNPGALGEACWNESFTNVHPNFGLPGCESGLVCIGNDVEAWCTTTCGITGEINTEAGVQNDWCCGEFVDVCDPMRFWVPTTMSVKCIPATAQLGQSCDTSTTWPSSAEGCAPVCSGTTLTYNTICLHIDTDYFCSLAFNCDPLGDPCATYNAAFTDGCCKEFMGGHWCTPASLCP